MAAWLSQDQLEKTGPDLFKEFLRYMPTVEYEDYFKNGVWKEDLMRLDLQMVVAHRLGAGAPEPLSLDEIPEVDLPLAAAKPAIQVPVQTGVLKAGPMGAAPVAATGASPVAPGVAELRLVALLVTKWKLDPTRTKTLLSQLSPAKRHYVIQNFKTEQTAPAPATDALEAYVKQQLEADAGKAGCQAAQPAVASSKPAAPKATLTPQGTLKPAVPVGLVPLAESASPAKAVPAKPALVVRNAPPFQPRPLGLVAQAGPGVAPAKRPFEAGCGSQFPAAKFPRTPFPGGVGGGCGSYGGGYGGGKGYGKMGW
mmetsp:Transcript_59381/g.109826  ORF Transcript_59381/g.109826 Transcript_59381/m.109826 type:complete len:311 (-) Transcript_59381:85-1017(-)